MSSRLDRILSRPRPLSLTSPYGALVAGQYLRAALLCLSDPVHLARIAERGEHGLRLAGNPDQRVTIHCIVAGSPAETVGESVACQTANTVHADSHTDEVDTRGGLNRVIDIPAR